jgi:hypothetical protein
MGQGARWCSSLASATSYNAFVTASQNLFLAQPCQMYVAILRFAYVCGG